jgi:hypothetical protein
MMVAVAVMA